MDIKYFFMPFEPIFDFIRNYQINLYGFTFTFMDVIVWSMLATIVIWFIKNLMD